MKGKNAIKLEALTYAEKNKIVNQKTIQAYIDGYDSCFKDHNLHTIMKRAYNSNFMTTEAIENEFQTEVAYCGLELAKKGKTKREIKKTFAVQLLISYNTMIDELKKQE